MKLFARRTSSNCQKVLWFLAELGLDYEFVPTGGDAGGLDAPEYRALNPNRRVPTLLDGDLTIWESHTILRYLAAKYGPARFWSSDAARLRDLFEIVGPSDATEVLIDDRPLPYARELWLPLVWFLLPR